MGGGLGVGGGAPDGEGGVGCEVFEEGREEGFLETFLAGLGEEGDCFSGA